MKTTLVYAGALTLAVRLGFCNNWSFEPPPRQTESEKTNQQSRLHVPPHSLIGEGGVRDDILTEDEEARFNRFVMERSLEAFRVRLEHPMRTIEHLFGESAGERMGDAFADDGENLVASVLRFTARERFVAPCISGTRSRTLLARAGKRRVLIHSMRLLFRGCAGDSTHSSVPFGRTRISAASGVSRTGPGRSSGKSAVSSSTRPLTLNAA